LWSEFPESIRSEFSEPTAVIARAPSSRQTLELRVVIARTRVVTESGIVVVPKGMLAQQPADQGDACRHRARAPSSRQTKELRAVIARAPSSRQTVDLRAVVEAYLVDR